MTLKLVAPEKVGLSPQRLQRLMEVLKSETDKKRLPGAVAVVARSRRRSDRDRRVPIHRSRREPGFDLLARDRAGETRAGSLRKPP